MKMQLASKGIIPQLLLACYAFRALTIFNRMNLSPRLEKIIYTIRPCRALADIGCDHGYVAISAVKRGKAERVIAADVADGPLKAAGRNSKAEGVSEQIRLLLSDGFKNIPEDAELDCAIIAGMGGLLMIRILKEAGAKRLSSFKQLVLSPQSDMDMVRRFIAKELRFTIRREHMVLDEGKYYYIMDVSTAAFAERAYSPREELFGRHIAEDSVKVYVDFLKQRQRVTERAYRAASLGTSADATAKAERLRIILSYIEEALTDKTLLHTTSIL